ncbi:hypothetical protein Cgig2_011465 [Carnegiea gigantea]|uniref:Transducin/WD40 repeat-like superfamily protein n=1 Tax=Carnegiea gigantea TaxID=171969 RepID=A0A9Q1QNZ6_9CARY|nr:hypothetical protein Cgig2_011465 [Carnegiea gigantea]
MPRTTAVECPGCPPLRALSFDILGLVKVIEARRKQGGVPKVVERWGDPDSSKCVLAASIDDRETNPVFSLSLPPLSPIPLCVCPTVRLFLLAVARKNGLVSLVPMTEKGYKDSCFFHSRSQFVEGLSPVSGELCFSISDTDAGTSPQDDPIIGLHLFKRNRSDSPSRSCTLLACMTKGKASLRTVEISKNGSASCATKEAWSVCSSGSICCSKVNGDESHSVFGGKGVELNMWDLEKTSKIWNARSPPKDSLGIFTPTWFTSVTFLSKDDHRKVVAGTNNHQVRLYDISAQGRPVLSVDFRETPIKAVAEDSDGYTIYCGSGSGDLSSIDIRTGKLLGCFIGKCSGSIRSISRHPEHSVIASCGLDSYVRFWDTKSRQLLSAVFLKQHLTNVIFDSKFSDEEIAPTATDEVQNEVHNEQQSEGEPEAADEEPPVKTKRKKASKEKSSGAKKLKHKKKKAKKVEASVEDDTLDYENE